MQASTAVADTVIQNVRRTPSLIRGGSVPFMIASDSRSAPERVSTRDAIYHGCDLS